MVKAMSAVPLYKQIVNDLMEKIDGGVFKEGDKLPTETDLMDQYDVSRITVRAAIKELEDADMVERTRGKGTFVTMKRDTYAADDRESFTHSCMLSGKKPSTKVLQAGWVYPSLKDMRFLGVREDENILQTRSFVWSMAFRLFWKPTVMPHLAFLDHEDLSGSLLEVS